MNNIDFYLIHYFHQIYNPDDLIQKVYKNNTPFSDIIKKYETYRASCGTISKDGDLNRKYKSCQNNSPKQIDLDYLNNFIQKAKTYDNYINIRINQLISSPENPNKKLLKFKINYN